MELSKERQKNYLWRYQKSKYNSVLDFYKTCSFAKQQAENNLIHYMKKIGGYGYKIICGNGFHFTAGWLLNSKNKTYLYIETHCNTYVIAITET